MVIFFSFTRGKMELFELGKPNSIHFPQNKICIRTERFLTKSPFYNVQEYNASQAFFYLTKKFQSTLKSMKKLEF